MKKREFNKLCRIHFGKIKSGELPLTDEQKHSMLLFIVSNRGAVHQSLVTKHLDRDWLTCMGYLHATGQFLHTGEHDPKTLNAKVHVNL